MDSITEGTYWPSSDSNTSTEDPNEDLASSSVLFKLIVYSIIGVIGLMGNLFVIIVIMSSTLMKKKFTNWFLVNQSVLDSCASFFMIVDVLTTERHALYYHGTSGEILCRLLTSKYILFSFYTASTYNLVSISIERYLEILHAVFHRNHFKRTVVILFLFLPWLLSFAFCLSGLILARTKDGECSQLTLDMPWESILLGWANFIFQFFLPLAIMVFCYVRIVQFLVEMKRRSTANNLLEKAMTNIVKTLIIVCMTFVLCWIWNSVLFLMYNMGWLLDFGGWFYHFTVTAVNMNSIANPLIYTLKYEQFRMEARIVLGIKSGKVKPSVTVSSVIKS